MTTDSASDALLQKQAYHAALNDALADSDEEPDDGRQASTRAMQHAASVAAESRARNAQALPRSVSDTNLATKDPLRRMPDLPADRASTSNPKRPPTLQKGATFSGPPSKRARIDAPQSSALLKAGPGKGKGQTVNCVPEAQQIFRGLQFYFFPNDEKNPARRMRITKALEFGAEWRKDWSDDVTHVIVDKVMDYSLLMRYLKMDSLPKNVVLVSEQYPAECLAYRSLIDPVQAEFRVKGAPATPTKPADIIARPRSPTSERSLQLKPAGKSVMARQPETPKTTDEPSSSVPLEFSPVIQVQQDDNAQRAPEKKTTAAESGVESTSEFDDIIRQARDMAHLPLEQDDEGASRPSNSEGPETDDEEAGKPSLNLVKKRSAKYNKPEDKWQCMQKHTGDKSGNPNAATIEILQQMATYYDQIGDGWRVRAYRKAMATLRNHPTKVWTRAEASSLPQIGDRLATKIEEIAFTNRLRRLENARAEPMDQVLQTFMNVYGAGYAKASEWVSQGYKTLDELLEKASLTDNQRIGIEHYNEFNSRIPRAEVAQHGEVVRRALHQIDPAFEVIIGGSFRRGASDSGDIDCLITRPETGPAHLRAVVVEQLVPRLTKCGFLVASLAATDKNDGSKWHGASCLPNSKVWRRIDLLLVPSDEIGAALIYFTGNDIFNRSLRLYASTKKLRLNQRGLYKDVIRGHGREKLSEGTLVEGKSEKRIFEILGVPWRPPEHRIC